jgi:DNA repair ATPase RecN
VQVLDDRGRVEELAAMMGGPPGEARQRSAAEMYEETLVVKRGAPGG